MSTRTLRIFVVFSVLSILGILTLQVFWFKTTFDDKEKEFQKNIRIALTEVVKGILEYNKTKGIPPDPVEQIDRNSFAVMVNDQIDSTILEHFLNKELKKFNIQQSYLYNIYDCSNRTMVEGRYVEGINHDVKLDETKILPRLNVDNYYFTIYFPHRSSGIFRQMDIWIYSSAVLFFVVIFFAYSLFVILRQKRLSEVQRDFINNMTHEIRTPISTIAISAETLKDPAITQHPQRLLNYAGIILDEAIKLKTQVERVLTVANTDTNTKLYFEDFDIHPVIHDTAEKIINASEKKIKLEFHLEASRHMVHADKLHMMNLVSNLVDNSVKYSRDEVHIAISSSNPRPGKIQLVFDDNGIGIAREHLGKIFDKFYRVPKGNVHDVKGFGIGLNFVKLITKVHKGTIKVHSEPGKGTTFILTLPAK